MSDLERALTELRHEIEWPATPDFAASSPAAQRRRPNLRARIALALVALLGVTLAVPPARSAVLEALGLKGAKIERTQPHATPTPHTGALGSGLHLGAPVTADEATQKADFEAAPPDAGLGAPDATFFSPGPPDGGRVSYVYQSGPDLPRAAETGAGLLVTEFLATVEPVIEKSAGSGTTLQRFTIDGAPAYWLAGRPHGFVYVARDGSVDTEDQRLAAPTLLVERHGLLIRIEGRITEARAVEIARSITAGTSRAP